MSQTLTHGLFKHLSSALLISACLISSPRVVFANQASPQPTDLNQLHTQLHNQLKQAVAAQNWQQAVRVVDRMLVAFPQRSAELNPYRQQLLSLAKVEPDRINQQLAPWLSQLQKRVESYWKPGYTGVSSPVVITFMVERNGTITKVAMAHSSGIEQVDKVALNAVYQAAPFAPLPPEYKDNLLRIHFTFDTNCISPVTSSSQPIVPPQP